MLLCLLMRAVMWKCNSYKWQHNLLSPIVWEGEEPWDSPHSLWALTSVIFLCADLQRNNSSIPLS